jgi:predicted DsbA family dithiol-disulfide isomerase
MPKEKITIDVISDVVCPWCYIGKRRLEKAVDQLKDQYEFDIHYHPFELNPAVPKKGYNQKVYLSEKFGGMERYEQLTARVTGVAADEGITFRYDLQNISPNTFDAHRIVWYAGQEGKQLATVEAFFKAYFTDGVDLSKKENLVTVAVAAGLNKEKVERLLETEEGTLEIKKEYAFNQNAGVTGVPFYIINNKYAVSGAQPADVFVDALEEIAKENQTDGPACGPDDNC